KKKKQRLTHPRVISAASQRNILRHCNLWLIICYRYTTSYKTVFQVWSQLTFLSILLFPISFCHVSFCPLFVLVIRHAVFRLSFQKTDEFVGYVFACPLRWMHLVVPIWFMSKLELNP
ncbi:hypothetical protein TGAM01_v209811, partial [Trichoderma gamsii]